MTAEIIMRFKLALVLLLILQIILCTTGELSKCEKVASLAAWKDHNTIVETNLKNLAGTWLSETCETRPGPSYLLRSYTFDHNGNYKLIQHHYWDESCSSPKLTITSYGHLLLIRNSIVQPGASSGFPKPINITIIPQDLRAARELDHLVANECPNQFWKSWRRNEEHLVYQRHETKLFRFWSQQQQQQQQHNSKNSAGPPNDIKCLGDLKWTFNELKLLKIQYRPIAFVDKTIENELEAELLLGDIHSDEKQRQFYTPTSFQFAVLLKQIRELKHNVTLNENQYSLKTSNRIVSKLMIISSNINAPPHLPEKAHLPPYIWGEWSSTRCEVRPQSLYLRRHFYFYSGNSVWVGEHRFFNDPLCKIPKFTVTAAGHLSIIGPNRDGLRGSTDVDFYIEKATLNVLDRRMILEMKMPGFCGVDQWKVNEPQELSPTNGCIYLGITIPSTQFDIVKLEIDYDGSWLLFMGQPDTGNAPGLNSERPTSFQWPMKKCGELPNISTTRRNGLSLVNTQSNKAITFRTSHFTLGSILILIVTLLIELR